MLDGGMGRGAEVDGQQDLRGNGAERIHFGHQGLLAVPLPWTACYFFVSHISLAMQKLDVIGNTHFASPGGSKTSRE
jgi:hypothetical protein